MRKIFIGSLVLGSALLGGYGCAGESAPAVQQATTAFAASPETRAATGVVAWELHDDEGEDSLRVVGADSQHRPVGEIRLHAERDEKGEISRVVVEHGAPDSDGDAVAEDRRGEALFAALAEDIRGAGPTLAPLGRGKCVWATVKLAAVCGATVATCIRSGGTETCGVLSEACGKAVKKWKCKCKGKCD